VNEQDQRVYRYRTSTGDTVELFKPYAAADEVRPVAAPVLSAKSGNDAIYEVTPASVPVAGGVRYRGFLTQRVPLVTAAQRQESGESIKEGITFLDAQIDASNSAVAREAVTRNGITGENIVTGTFATPRSQMA
jgi:hypothetical protein